MIRTLEATIDKDGRVHLSEPVQLPQARRAIVTILEETPRIPSTAQLSEEALAKDWNRPEEDEAWTHLDPASSSGFRFLTFRLQRPDRLLSLRARGFHSLPNYKQSIFRFFGYRD